MRNRSSRGLHSQNRGFPVGGDTLCGPNSIPYHEIWSELELSEHEVPYAGQYIYSWYCIAEEVSQALGTEDYDKYKDCPQLNCTAVEPIQ